MQTHAQQDQGNTHDDDTSLRLITEPEGARRFVPLRVAYVAICNGNTCAAAILAEFEYRTACRVKDGLSGDALWIYKAQPTLRADLWDTFTLHDIKHALKLLVDDLGYLAKRPTKRNALDKTLEYQFETAVVQCCVDAWAAEYLPQNQTLVREVARDLSGSHKRPVEQSQATDGASPATDGRSQATDAEVAGDRVLESLDSDAFTEGSTEATAAESRAGARAAAADGQTPFTPNLMLVKTIKPPDAAGDPGQEVPTLPVVAQSVDDANIFALYRKHIGEPDDLTSDVLAKVHAENTADEIVAAFEELSGRKVANRWAYVLTILREKRGKRLKQEQQRAEVAAVLQGVGESMRLPAAPPDCFGDDESSRDNWQRMELQIDAEFDAGAREYWRGARVTGWDGQTLVIELRAAHCLAFFKGMYGRALARLVRLFWGKDVQVALRVQEIAPIAVAEGV